MSKDLEDDELGKVSRDADDLLKKLDAIKSESRRDEQPQPATQNARRAHGRESDKSSTNNGESNSRFQLGVFFAIVFLITVAAVVNGKRREGIAPGTGGKGLELTNQGSASDSAELDGTPQEETSSMPSQEIYFKGIKLPITNSLCNKKNTFCINGLARLVEDERGSASYSFEDSDNGQRVSIQGEIRIASVERNGDGTRTFYFSFRDNQGVTTPGWAAAGTFQLDQDTKQPGILTRFKTTESFGPKTPVGLENTSYLFPR